jgi:hypothetical protein
MTNTTPSSTLIDDGSHFLKVDKTANVKMFKKGVPLGTKQYTYTAQEDRNYQAARTGLNIDLAFNNKDKK